VGSFLVDSFFLTSNTTTATVRYPVANWSVQRNAIEAGIFLAGLRTGANLIPTFKTDNLNINPQNGILTLNLTLDRSVSLELLYFSYVLWISSPDLRGSLTSSPLLSLNSWQFTGLSQIKDSKLAYSGLAFSKEAAAGSIPCQGSRCSSSCLFIAQCISSNGFISSNTCFLCGTG
jgi:hypothetical protein